jgi:hypothetical protein
LILSLVACQESRVPEDAVYYDVQVTAADIDGDGLADSCHPDNTEGYQEAFTYALAFDENSATIYIGEQVYAVGTIMGCDLTYQTVVIGEDTQNDGYVHWQLTGQAQVDQPGQDQCTSDDPDLDWVGTEYFEIISTDDDTLEPGCTYESTTAGAAQ